MHSVTVRTWYNIRTGLYPYCIHTVFQVNVRRRATVPIADFMPVAVACAVHASGLGTCLAQA